MFCFYVCCCLFFFFKQKTAYEMRISDWSSDVCSSDLIADHRHHAPLVVTLGQCNRHPQCRRDRGGTVADAKGVVCAFRAFRERSHATLELDREIGRASCREECVSTCRSRWSRYP